MHVIMMISVVYTHKPVTGPSTVMPHDTPHPGGVGYTVRCIVVCEQWLDPAGPGDPLAVVTTATAVYNTDIT